MVRVTLIFFGILFSLNLQASEASYYEQLQETCEQLKATCKAEAGVQNQICQQSVPDLMYCFQQYQREIQLCNKTYNCQ